MPTVAWLIAASVFVVGLIWLLWWKPKQQAKREAARLAVAQADRARRVAEDEEFQRWLLSEEFRRLNQPAYYITLINHRSNPLAMTFVLPEPIASGALTTGSPVFTDQASLAPYAGLLLTGAWEVFQDLVVDPMVVSVQVRDATGFTVVFTTAALQDYSLAGVGGGEPYHGGVYGPLNQLKKYVVKERQMLTETALLPLP